MPRTKWQHGDPLDPAYQERLRALLRERGEDAVIELMEISITAILRAAAGTGIRNVTAVAIKAKLDGLRSS